jgi:hypothetical protein
MHHPSLVPAGRHVEFAAAMIEAAKEKPPAD